MGQAAFEALGYLESVDQCSPYIDQFIERLKVLPSNEAISRFQDPQWNYQVQNNKSKSAKAVGEQDLYHETNVKKTIDIAEFHTFNKQYFEATNALSTSAIGSPTCQLAEYSAQVALIQGNYSAVLNQDKRVEAFLTTSLSNELYLKRLTDQEVTSYWRVKYLILIAHFLKQEYEEAANLIYDLVDAPAIQSASGKQISALQLLKDSDFGQYIYEDEIVLASFISILLYKDPSELNNTLNDTEFTTLTGSKITDIRPFFISLNAAKFKELNILLDKLNYVGETNVFFNRVWSQIRLKFRKKSYSLYLRLAVRVSADHLSNRLNIEKGKLVKEINDYIKEKRLEFSYDAENEIFETNKKDKRIDFAESLQKLCEASDTVENLLREKLENAQKNALKAKNALNKRQDEIN